jgi:uncharacterized protein (TIGR03435 family)
MERPRIASREMSLRQTSSEPGEANRMKNAVSRRDAARLCVAAACSAALLHRRTAFAQTATTPAVAPPEFEVATIKPSNFDPSNYTSGIKTGYGRLDGQNVTLRRCIMGAYGVGPHQVVGGPDWIDSQRFDIQAKADQPIDDDAILNQMLQSLLADRFKLTLHLEARATSAYVLEVDKKGQKLEVSQGGESVTNTSTGRGGRVSMEIRNTDMDMFAKVLSRAMDLPVVNETGLTGLFNFTLHWTPDNMQPSAQTADDVSIFTGIQEQLGLRLRAAKAPIEVLVIDHAEMPTPN